jgi:hypothetical protein
VFWPSRLTRRTLASRNMLRFGTSTWVTALSIAAVGASIGLAGVAIGSWIARIGVNARTDAESSTLSLPPSVPGEESPTGPFAGVSEDARYRGYTDERKMLYDQNRETSKLLDQSLLGLSGGALGISLTFIKQVVPNPLPESAIFLVESWVYFGVSILLTMFALQASIHAVEKASDMLDQGFLAQSRVEQNRFAVWTGRLNVASISFFVFGVGLLTWFAIQRSRLGCAVKVAAQLRRSDHVTRFSERPAPPAARAPI